MTAEINAGICHLAFDIAEGDVFNEAAVITAGRYKMQTDEVGFCKFGYHIFHQNIPHDDLAAAGNAEGTGVIHGMDLQNINVAEGNVLNDIGSRGVIVSYGAHIDGMGVVGPQDTVCDFIVTGRALITPTGAVNSDAVVIGAEKAVLDGDIRCGHRIKSIAPLGSGNGLEIVHGKSCGIARINGIAHGISHKDTADRHIFGC